MDQVIKLEDFTYSGNFAEALDTLARLIGFGEADVKLIVHEGQITGIDWQFGDTLLKWRKKNGG